MKNKKGLLLKTLACFLLAAALIFTGESKAGEISPKLKIFLYNCAGPVEVNTYKGATLVMGPGQFQKAPLPPNVTFKVIHDGQWLVIKDGSEEIARQVGDHLYFYPSASDGFLKFRDHLYRGGLEVKCYNGELIVINHIDLENYLKGVLPMELGDVPSEALKAQAVAARTYALGHRKKDRPYDLTADQSSQVYGGASVENSYCSKAIEETAGQVLSYDGKLAGFALYFSSCGGATARIDDVFDADPVEYLESVYCSYSSPPENQAPVNDGNPANLPLPPAPPDAFCSGSPLFHWQVTWESSELENIIRSNLPKECFSGKLVDIKVIERSVSGRVKKLLIASEGAETVIEGDKTRKVLRFRSGDKLQWLYSSLFEIKKSGDRYIANGRGWGHGVGMCQWGALKLAETGEDYRTILGQYYPECQIVPYTTLSDEK
ncbi:MAG: SpoIID/LytB domain-containing protein [Chloroflexi bacterium]|nr:SpoIID/LytB domain-containing protein [Chloroflexota bacterium]